MKMVNMKKIYYLAALIMAVAWFLGVFALDAGKAIHSVLMVGALSFLQGVITCEDIKAQQSRWTKEP